jgi:hypothetical protein
MNVSALSDYKQQLNSHAQVRDLLMTFVSPLAITTSNSVILQASALVQLTEATNQLTRTSTLIACERCYALAYALWSMSTKISSEDVHNGANQILQCTSNVLTVSVFDEKR